jgi:hypothetical protein
MGGSAEFVSIVKDVATTIIAGLAMDVAWQGSRLGAANRRAMLISRPRGSSYSRRTSCATPWRASGRR